MKRKLTILYEDNHLLGVIKPVNMPVQADDSGDLDLLSACKAYIKEAYAKPGEVYLGLVHRLDRPVGGALVFARTSKAAARLQKSMQDNQWQKQYLAVVQGSAAQEARLVDHLVREGAFTRTAPEGTPGAQRAELSYEKLAEREGLSLLCVTLCTGRRHQIRAQLAGAGLPIWGDQRYNPAARPGQQIALHAALLSFPHPTKDECVTLLSRPELPPFSQFLPETSDFFAALSGNC